MVYTLTKKEAASRQIHAAISHLYNEEYECVITLAGAAEDILGNIEPLHLWKVLMHKRPDGHSEKEWSTILTETRNWLKHPADSLGPKRKISEVEAAIMLIRAVSKFHAQYKESTETMQQFVMWFTRSGFASTEDLA